MTALDLYKYIKNNKIEWHWIEQKTDVIIFPAFHEVEDFLKLLNTSDFDDDGILCNIKDGYFAIEIGYIMEHHNIELSEVFTADENDF